jgi:enoyl-CoA hydratase/3-hydroxyacyl-CoA dehydrogenase
MPEINKVAVIGAGIMGHGIAQVAATAGQEVRLVDVSKELLERATERILWSLGKLAEKAAIKESPQEIVSRITGTTDLFGAVSDVDLVIEAVPEDIELKAKVLADVDKAAPPRAILATNTSGLPISALSARISRPEKFVGTHWMNPPVFMRLVEIIKGDSTSEETLQTIIELCQQYYGKEVVVAKKEVWNFLTGRAHMGWNLGTACLYHIGEATAEEIDAMARYEMSLPMGPFELADFTGSNEIRAGGLKSIKVLLEKYPGFEPWPAFFQAFEYITEVVSKPLVEKGLLGVKSGQGFYTYPEPGKYRKAEVSQELTGKVNPAKVLAVAANTSAWCVTNGVGSAEEVEKSFRMAYGWPKGIFEFAAEYGPSNIIKELRHGLETAPEPMRLIYEPDPLLLDMST